MANRPNILFIFDDQHRHDYLGAAGASFLNTPNLDRLAQRGIRFTQAATNCPLSAPSRMALATGLQPIRAGVLANDFGRVPHGVPTFFQRMRDHGYWTASAGKLHLGPTGAAGPKGDPPGAYTLGFTHPCECEGKMGAGHLPTPSGPYTHYLYEQGLLDAFHRDYQKRIRTGWARANWDSVLPAEAFEDAFIGRKAAEWIRDVPEIHPWMMFVNFVGPHSPFDPPTEIADRYREVAMPDVVPADMDGKPEWIRQRDHGLAPESVVEAQRQYCGAIEAIDDQVGRMLQVLEQRGMMDNTYIIFSSDHGEMLGDFGMYAKYVAYEGSLRVPLIVSGPGIQGGGVSDALVELIDVNPTICELAGLGMQEHIDAQSFVPALTSDAAEHRTETASVIENFRCIRTRQYKLIHNYNDAFELYDLENDPQELNNVANQRPGVFEELHGRLRERFFGGRSLPKGMDIRI
ncbi:MAG: sulfatase-like hydrolase/transferase [Gemmatimonadetes bacterium]|jgi:arylsulfatase|nr:sulfatase-like hydrolase/transferase [Gemmatimonadota bacterium]MBT6147099.1 sulfatase-like hydrolase/transferase [Gemmatimonadota bacterium]MBT7862452.1 sulfatase-like hydrolase/transferase [Gemmatimonadota bacterium]